MKIKTKYNIGDEVWSLCNGRIVQLIVSQIDLVITGPYIYTTYGLRFKNEPIITVDTTERFLFPTKEELLKSL